ncbi:MAG: helix-turn-helix transcriptional regulator [Gemmobacter sp.]
MTATVQPITPPTGLRRMDAARHCGVSPGHFDAMVKAGVLPAPRSLGTVKLWLRQELDDALFGLAGQAHDGGANGCDALFGL